MWDRDINKLEQVQKNVARFVTGDYRLTTSKTSLVKLIGWDPLEKKHLLFQVTMYKIRNNLINVSVPSSILSLRRSQSSYSHSYSYRQPGVNMYSYGCSFFTQAVSRPVSEKISRRAIIRSPWLTEACDGVRWLKWLKMQHPGACRFRLLFNHKGDKLSRLLSAKKIFLIHLNGFFLTW